jgi:Protein of unknown function (DUF1579)
MKTLFGVSGMLALSIGVLAQAPATPKPGPEEKALTYFVGKWSTDAEMKASPLGPGGKVSSVDTCEVFAGGFHVVCRGSGTGPMGAMNSLGILSYNAADKAYAYYGIDNTGTTELARGQKAGSTWTFTSKSVIGGTSMHSRYTMVEGTPTSYTFKWETSADGTTWNTMIEGKSTRVKGT